MDKSTINRRALLAAGIYLAVGAFWIFYSDALLLDLFPGQIARLTKFQTYKGWLFVATTALLIFLLMRQALQQQARIMSRLIETEYRYHLLYDYAPDLFASIDPETHTIIHCNRTMVEVLGYTEAELLGKKLPELCHPDSLNDMDQLLKTINTPEGMKTRELQLLRKDGSSLPASLNQSAVKGEGGEVLYYNTMWRDISEHKRIEDRLQENRRMLTTLIDNLPGLVYRCRNDRDWTMEYMSEDTTDITGYPVQDFISGRIYWGLIIHPEDQEPVWEKVQAAVQAHRPFELEYRIQHQNGREKWVWEQGCGVFDPEGGLIALEGVRFDITDRKRLEQIATEDELKIHHMLEANPTIMVAMKVENRRIIPYWMSDSITRIFGYTVEEALAPTWWPDRLHPEDRDYCVAGLKGLLDREYYSYEYRLKHKDGHYLYVHDELRILRDDSGMPIEVLCTWSDITRQQEEREKIQFYTAAFANTTEGVVITDLQGEIRSVNHAFEEITGYSEQELRGQNPRILHSGKHDEEFYQSMWRRLKDTGVWQGEIWNRRKSGEIYPQWLNITTIFDDQNRPSHYVGVSTDVSQRKLTEYKLEHLAHYDALTDLPNRLLLQLRLEHAMQQTARHKGRVGIVFIDLDDFKKVNDSLGHTTGDELLKAVAGRWLKRLRAEDTLGRLGGDEFLLLLENIKSTDEVGVVVRDLLTSIDEPFVLSNGNEVFVEASIGVSIYPDDGTETGTLLQNADLAMYRSKDRGRNFISFFTDEMGITANERLSLETALRQALAGRDELLLYYQPKVDAHSGMMTGVEALARWKRGNTEMIPPLKFIPIAEKTGLIQKLGERVLSEACRQLRSWIDQGIRPVLTCVNVSVQQLRNEKFYDTVTHILDEYAIDSKYLGLEITESALMEHPEEFISIIRKLKDIGVQIALDDFGTGFSNLSYLTRYPIDVLKIDSSFVEGIGTDHNALKLIDSIIVLAENFGMCTVAEGVETREQLDYLVKAGCNEIQGYYFSKPLPVEKIEKLLRLNKSLYVKQ